MDTAPRDRVGTVLLTIAALMVAGTTAVYLGLLSQQGTFGPRVAFVTCFLVAIAAVAGIAAAWGMRGRPASRPWVFGAAIGALGIGIVGAFSIGLPLILAAILLFLAAPRAAGHAGPTAAASIVALAILALGLVLTR